MFLGDLLTRAANCYPDKTGSIDEGDDTRLSFVELNARCNAISHALTDMGVGPGDRVAIVCHNCHHYLESVFAVAKAGGVATSLNWRLAPKELAFLLDHSDARVVIFSKRFEALFQKVRELLDKEIRVISVGGDLADAAAYEELAAAYPKTEPGIQPAGMDSPVLQMYTSGTTGQPKGVMLTHRNVIANSMNTVIEQQFNRSDICLNVLPIFHIAIYGAINCVLIGATNVFQPEFDLEAVLSVIEKERVTGMGLAPILINYIVNHPKIDEYDLSSLRWINYATAPMPVPLLKKAMEKLQCDFMQVFGQTETSPVISILIPEDHVVEGPEHKARRLGSVGRPILNVEIKVVDPEDRECPQGEVGEITAFGDTMMKGYYKQPEATAQTIKDGWLYTGDMGYFDEYGYLYLVDRKKDMIISGGENIYPNEVEMCILQMDGVAETAVVGVPDEEWGEAVKAFVVPRPGAEITADQVIRHCAENIAGYKKPKSVEFVEEFPRNAVGKILKNKLREPYWKDRERKI
jgi:long-chain acyl-CoA synthetase